MRNGLELVKHYEGCSLKAYLCPAHVWTIGYGRTTNVKPDDTCSQAQADAWLIAEYDEFEAKVRALVTVDLSANQLGALTSLAYNIGLGNLSKSTLLKRLNARDYTGATAQFLVWNKANGRTLNGLSKRRQSEARLFATK